jgi:hypothetical protein
LDLVIKKGDLIIIRDERMRITDLNFKKQEFSGSLILSGEERTRRNLYMPANHKRSETETVKVSSLDRDKVTLHIPGPDKETLKMMEVIAGEKFYQFPNEDIKAEMYRTHLNLAVRGNYEPYVLYPGEKGGLAVNQLNYYRELNDERVINPFSPEGHEAVIAAMDKGVDYSALRDGDKEEVEKIFPYLHGAKIMKEVEKERGEELDDGEMVLEGDDEAKEPDKTEREDSGRSAYESRLAGLLRAAVDSGSLARPWEPGTPAAPYNPATGEVYGGINGITCLLHQVSGETADPRYLTMNDINRSGMTIQAQAQPLCLPYSDIIEETHTEARRDPAWRLLYNAADIEGMPENRRVPRETTGPCMYPRPGQTNEQQAANTLAAFIAAAKTGGGYTPSPSVESLNAAFIDELAEKPGKVLGFFQSVNSMAAVMLNREAEGVREDKALAVGY